MTNDEIGRAPWERTEDFVVWEDAPTEKKQPVFDLEERTARFGEAIIDFLKKTPIRPRTNRLIDQLTGCGTSIGGNYCEADDAVSSKEFIHIIGTCRKEARETKFFLRVLARACPEMAGGARVLWQKANELH